MNLGDIGLSLDEPVRYRRRAGARPQEGRVRRIESDGSIGLRDANGASRSLPVEAVEVSVVGPRGGTGWEPLANRIARAEQLRLL